jgi:large subunit ribosomal protein L18e
MLNVPARKEKKVNVSKLDKLVPSGAYVVVPGKVLGTGTLSKKLIIGAYDFSASAMEKIKRAKGKPLYLDKFAKKFAKKEGLILIGG